ncbi:MAG TPA: methyltransferase [Ferruginibacter sp.]|jgi:tRNA1Val (adenine37-N6)-methyltransferase|nr:methyltransferase [Ferruginibacter sp.]
MPNNYFQFKQFIIHQDKCAMKVCTDACLFGALVADSQLAATRALDIGTGTGLLSLMYAQKNDAVRIDAFEIDPDAAAQATENFERSAWDDRLQVFNKDILSLDPGPVPVPGSVHDIYDLILCNPPFFENDLHSPNEATNNARHDTSLTLVELLHIVDTLLTAGGTFAVLLPYLRVDYFIEEAKKLNLHCNRQVLVKQTPAHPFFRGILFFNREEKETTSSEMIIKDENDQYTNEFVTALKDYYLKL